MFDIGFLFVLGIIGVCALIWWLLTRKKPLIHSGQKLTITNSEGTTKAEVEKVDGNTVTLKQEPKGPKIRNQSLRKRLFNFLREKVLWDSREGAAVLGRNAAKRRMKGTHRRAVMPGSARPPKAKRCVRIGGHRFNRHPWGETVQTDSGPVKRCRRCKATRRMAA